MANKDFENFYLKQGLTTIAGLDEAGRGPLAGPVVVACVVFPNSYSNDQINDSKKLSAKKRLELYKEIIAKAIAYNIQVIDVKTIDKINIYQASKKGMIDALNALKIKVDVALTDAMPLPNLSYQVKSIIKGDSKSITIAAASILAKVTRDQIMDQLDKIHPEYGFGKHKGYPTKQHLQALKKFGATKHHRKSFKPVADIINKK